jgi:hypothetical protein
MFSSGVAIVVAALLAACGARTGGPVPSGADPAQLAPASALLYIEATVRPQGTQRADAETALTKLAGGSIDGKLRQAIDKALKKDGLSYANDVQPWLGQKIGLVVLAPTSSGVAVIAPTGNPAAARSFITRALKGHPDETGGVIGHDAVIGGPDAVAAIRDAAHGQSLASTPAFTTAMAQLPGDAVTRVYANLHGLLTAITSTAGALSHNALGTANLLSSLRGALARYPAGATAAGALTLAPHTVALDGVQAGVPARGGGGSSANVAGLPAGSWLALATGGLISKATQQEFLHGLNLGFAQSLSSSGGLANPIAGAMLHQVSGVARQVFSALGPMTLSLAGSSPLAIRAGLTLKPASMRAFNGLLAQLRSLISTKSPFKISGSATHFSVALPTGQQLSVSEPGGTVVATYGYPDAQSFQKPSATLAGDPAFRRAASQLIAGSSVPLFVSFAPLATFASLADSSASGKKALRVLQRLDYLIAGGTRGHGRVVLGLN